MGGPCSPGQRGPGPHLVPVWLRPHCACANQGVRCQTAAVGRSRTVPPRQQRKHTQNNPTDLVLSRYQELQKRYSLHRTGLICCRSWAAVGPPAVIEPDQPQGHWLPSTSLHRNVPLSRAEFWASRTTSARSGFRFDPCLTANPFQITELGEPAARGAPAHENHVDPVRYGDQGSAC